MSNQSEPADFKTLFTIDTPLLDLRAPVEFSQGAFPTAFNLPLMTDEERKKVGTCYKRHGQDAAIKLGNRLVSGETREHRIESWKSFIKANPEGQLYCFRGGLRSTTVQKWLADEGYHYPLVEGGYKALRRFLINSTEHLANHFNFTIIGGRTGTRKTDLILAHENSVDLEGRANHRGSSFGRRVGGQPPVINFENNIAIDLLKLKVKYSKVYLEDEGVTVGSCSVPEPLRGIMKSAPIFIVEATVEERVENILRDYVLTLREDYLLESPLLGLSNYREAMFSSLHRIKKRLGGERTAQLYQLMENAFDAPISGSNDLHRDWIRQLIVEYYDPMYDFQLAKKEQRVIERGDWDTISTMMS